LLYWKLDEVDKAEAEFREELKRFPTDPVSNCLLGQIALRRDDAPASRPLFQAAVAANPRYKEALFGLGKADIKLGDPAAALAPLRKAVDIDPNYAEAHYQLGTALAKLGRTSEAEKEHSISIAIQAKQQSDYAKRLSRAPSSQQ
jgi:tetratricopeptide (TPR) repeat protein